MRFELPYGKDGHQILEVPDENLSAVLRPNEVECDEPQHEIRKGLLNPLGLSTIRSFLEGDGETVFIVNDGTRPTPTSSVLEAISGFADLRRFRYLVATGAHRPPTEPEYQMIFGRWYPLLADRIKAHDSRKDIMIHLGRSKNGTEMLVNEIAAKADSLLIITSVEPHYFAGYTGGRKSFLPGVAAHKTIEQNHRLAMRPEAQVLRLEGNPVHEDMMDAIKCIENKNIFAVQVVLDRHQSIYRVVAGDLHRSFRKAVEYANQVFCVPIKERADVVISIAQYPMDIDLYQSQKAMDNANWALKPGGTLIFVSECRDGIGDRTFYDQLSSSMDLEEILRNLETEYRLGYHKAAKMAEIAKRGKICGVTSLRPDDLSKINIRPFSSVQEAVDSALLGNPKAKVLVMFEGSVLVPRLTGNG